MIGKRLDATGRPRRVIRRKGLREPRSGLGVGRKRADAAPALFPAALRARYAVGGLSSQVAASAESQGGRLWRWRCRSALLLSGLSQRPRYGLIGLVNLRDGCLAGDTTLTPGVAVGAPRGCAPRVCADATTAATVRLGVWSDGVSRKPLVEQLGEIDER